LAGDEADLRAQTEAWEVEITQVVAQQVKARRDALNLRAQDLADRCAALGVHLPRGTIAKLEAGTRRQVTVPELIALAAALRTSPALLIAPISMGTASIELLPGRAVHTSEAYAWLTAQGGARELFGEHARLVTRIQMDEGAITHVRHRRREALDAKDEALAADLDEGVREKAQQLDESWAKLLDLRDRLRFYGFALPPLPDRLAHRERTGQSDLWGIDLAGGEGGA
jgi:transcriptional regulator with XRE-family HTH domain